ncbi:hypothetical protein L550_1046 [Bordetella pertussis H973]|uniref:Uncharacterized protein n=1 Tax=Bordetella pertussis CHLA-26 TaxID=1331284 RepID=A0AAI9J059_BORPT|nr:hypothetical protein V483_1753 [Bordetella pertussis CHLA-11]ETG98679.1 hypothetical protein L569_1760 [Bordetella pertussis 2250905]ETH03353.1 hypothetical protein L570_1649 [Bordetella pertussis 2356847]ETH06828.1 hypothetical protein L571_1706 [Bordetella pertussis 2371640]ETH12574.1 hypothetical protein L574_1919 [Bordetella pertussis STO1-SEAT-0006]ETH14401.1 hypothetical protein L575_1441 [Bordetella pertussis STO1-SEAT-0007]ETH18122.1 hypothetical protein L563_1624 [Bordetella pertu
MLLGGDSGLAVRPLGADRFDPVVSRGDCRQIAAFHSEKNATFYTFIYEIADIEMQIM